MRLFTFFICLISSIGLSYTQDANSFVLFGNHTDLTLTTEYRVSGDEDMVTTGVDEIYPWENAHYHDLGNRVVTTILNVVFNLDVDHKEKPFLVKSNRFSFSGNKNYSVEIDIKKGDQLLFTILFDFIDYPNRLDNPTNYNVKYPDGTLDVSAPYSLLSEQQNSPHQATREIMINGVSHKLVYGTFHDAIDPTNNVLFSLSETNPVSLHYDPPASEVNDPTVLNVLTYNIGLLMPAGSNDQEERERVKVIHEVIPKNMDIIIWQEMFETAFLFQIYNNLKDHYPYRSGFTHNEATIPGLTKNGGVFFMSKHPIIDEKDFSYLDDAGIEASGESVLADKGVKYVKVNKEGQIIHAFGTHTSGQAIENDAMGRWMKEIAPSNYDEITIMGGDMNTSFTGRSYYRMLDSLGALEPTYNSLKGNQLQTRGTTWGFNHYGGGREDNGNLIDYVFTSEYFKFPTVYFNETQVYRYNGLSRDAWGIFDMGDHQPVYARFEFPTSNISSSDTVICPGDPLSISASTSLTDYTAQWFKDDTELIGETGLTYSKTAITEEDYGAYKVEIYYNYFPDIATNSRVVEDTLRPIRDSIAKYEFIQDICFNSRTMQMDSSCRDSILGIFNNPDSVTVYEVCFDSATMQIDPSCEDSIIGILNNPDSFRIYNNCFDTVTLQLDLACRDSILAEIAADTFGVYYAPGLKKGKLVETITINPDQVLCPFVTNIIETKFGTINIYPNPVGDELFINLDNSKASNKEVSILIYTATAEIIYSNKIKRSEIIDVSNWPSGIYFMKVEFDGGYSSVRFVKD